MRNRQTTKESQPFPLYRLRYDSKEKAVIFLCKQKASTCLLPAGKETKAGLPYYRHSHAPDCSSRHSAQT